MHSASIVLHAWSIISESEMSIIFLCLLHMFTQLHSIWIKNFSKSTPVIKVAAVKNTIMLYIPFIVWNRSIHCPSLSATFNSLHSSTNQELFEKYLCNWGSHYISVTQRRKGSHYVQPPNQHFSLSAKMNGTERRALVSPWRMHWTHCSMLKGTSWDEATSSSEKIKPIALVVIELC